MPPLQSAVKDLRSQVCREACQTVAFIALKLGTKSEYFMEPMMGTLFGLLVANAKIVSVTGSSAIVIIYESVHTHRLIAPLQTQMQSKSKDIRRAVCNVLKVIFQHWAPQIIQKNLPVVIEIFKKGIVDADSEARTLTRQCFPDLKELFPQAANTVMDSLSALERRTLQQNLERQQQQGGGSGGGRGDISMGSLGHPKTNGTSGTRSNTSSLTRQGSIKKPAISGISGIPMLSSRASPVKTVNSGRSTSAIDLQAANRARQHHFSTLK